MIVSVCCFATASFCCDTAAIQLHAGFWDGRILKLFIDVEIIRQGGLTYVSIRDRLYVSIENRQKWEERKKKQKTGRKQIKTDRKQIENRQKTGGNRL